jgi:hypothetical protein
MTLSGHAPLRGGEESLNMGHGTSNMAGRKEEDSREEKRETWRECEVEQRKQAGICP